MSETAPTPEQRAVSICVIAKAVGKGLPRSHTARCGHCKLVADQIKAAVAVECARHNPPIWSLAGRSPLDHHM